MKDPEDAELQMWNTGEAGATPSHLREVTCGQLPVTSLSAAHRAALWPCPLTAGGNGSLWLNCTCALGPGE